MAFSLPGAGERIDMNLQFKANGQTANYAVEVPFDTDLATTMANGLAIAALYASASGCELSVLSFNIKAVDDAAAAEVAGASIYEIGQLNVNLAPSGTSQDSTGKIRFPYPLSTVRSGAQGTKGWYQINTAATEITDLVTAFTAAGDGSVSDGQKVTTLDSGRVYPRGGRPRV